MAAYASYLDVEHGFRTLTMEEISLCTQLLNEAAIIIDAVNSNAASDIKMLVSCHMVRRVLSQGIDTTVPRGATQGSIAALGYSESWTLSSGSVSELYLSKLDKKLLGVSNRIGIINPLEGMVAP